MNGNIIYKQNKQKNGEKSMEIKKVNETLNTIIGKIGKGDVIAMDSLSESIEFEMDKLKSLEDNSRFGIGLRLFQNGAVGNSFVNSIDETDILIKKSRQSAELGEKIVFDLPKKAKFPEMNLYYPEVIQFEKEKAVEIGWDTVRRMKQLDDRAKVSVGISKGHSRNYFANTEGILESYQETYYSYYVSMLLVEEGGSLLHVGDSDITYDTDVEKERIDKNVEWRYKNALKKVSVESGYFPIILAPDSLGLLLSSIRIAANGKSLYKGISVLSDKLNEKIADDCFSLVDDPFYEKGLGSYPFDDEGIVPNPMPIIENGVFRNYIYDLSTATRMNTKSTGHGSRGLGSLPNPSYSNLIFSTGKATIEDMIASVPYGLYVVDTIGGGMSNVVNGDFSVNIGLGYLIENGKVKGRVKDVMIAGNAFEALNNIKAMENKLHRQGSVFAPHVLLDNVSVYS